jgi:hypothetical protein
MTTATTTKCNFTTIENALHSALYHLRHAAHDAKSLHIATGKAQRAATLLKRANSQVQKGGAK